MAWEPKAPGNTAQDRVLPLGQVEARRTQDSRDAPASGTPELCRSAPPPPVNPDPCGLATAVVTTGVDSGAGELAAANIVLPPGVTLCLGLSRATSEQGPHRINSFH